jgi:organic radical activating enzyme
MNKKRIFPIKNDPACLLKWGWSTIYFQSGTTNSCSRTEKNLIDPNNFDQFHNVPEKIVARELMLKGEWPGHGCEYCKYVEDIGGISERVFHLDQQQDPGLTAPELFENNQAVHVTPTMLEVWFKNTCNMACLYCGPHFSSLWEDENRKYGNLFTERNDDHWQYTMHQSYTNPHYDEMVAGLWQYLESDNRYQKLRRFHILGGEPFLLRELDECLDFWDSHSNPDLVISIITNLNIPHKRFLTYVSRFEQLVKQNKIWKIQITGSLDCWGPEIEYVRYGLDLNTWKENFQSLLDKPWATLSVNSALSALTIKKLPALVEKINEWNKARPAESDPICFSYNLTGGADDPKHFGPGVFDDDFALALSQLDRKTPMDIGVYDGLESMSNLIKRSPKNLEKINKLKTYLDQLDVRRNTNWRTTFPWLDNDFT